MVYLFIVCTILLGLIYCFFLQYLIHNLQDSLEDTLATHAAASARQRAPVCQGRGLSEFSTLLDIPSRWLPRVSEPLTHHPSTRSGACEGRLTMVFDGVRYTEFFVVCVDAPGDLCYRYTEGLMMALHRIKAKLARHIQILEAQCPYRVCDDLTPDNIVKRAKQVKTKEVRKKK